MNERVIVKEWITQHGHNVKIVEIDFHTPAIPPYYCGYIAIPKDKLFDDNMEVHGGITYDEIEDGVRWIGYDCTHYGDTRTTCTLDYCIEQCESVSKQVGL